MGGRGSLLDMLVDGLLKAIVLAHGAYLERKPHAWLDDEKPGV